MKLSLYLSDGGNYVLVPDCFLPSMQCEHEHGPLTSCGQVAVPDLPRKRAWQKVLAEIEANAYAFIDVGQAERLLDVKIIRAPNGHASTRAARRTIKSSAERPVG